MLRVYLAGKISLNDWRSGLLGPRPLSVDLSDINEPWGEQRIPGFNAVAIGPWFVSCDHGCAHGEAEHGQGIVADGGCVDTVDHLTRFCIVDRCLAAIDSCDLFFAWSEPGAYGTMIEIGYAKAKGKPIHVGFPADRDTNHDDLWFSRFIATAVHPAKTGAEAVRRALFCVSSAKREACESPLEGRMFDALTTAYMAGFSFHNQFEVGPYRLDFAFLHHDGRRVAVEVDGHDYHERTKEQARNDKKRDRYLTRNGWQVLRFTGQEIHRDADRCASEVSAQLCGMTEKAGA